MIIEPHELVVIASVQPRSFSFCLKAFIFLLKNKNIPFISVRAAGAEASSAVNQQQHKLKEAGWDR